MNFGMKWQKSCSCNFPTLNSSAPITKFISIHTIQAISSSSIFRRPVDSSRVDREGKCKIYVQQSITWCVQINKFLQRFNPLPKDICFKFCDGILKLIKNTRCWRSLFAFSCSVKARCSARKVGKILTSMRLKSLV